MTAAGPFRRLLGLAWSYRRACLGAFTGQVITLALGLGALGMSGLGIDLLRQALDPAAPAVRWPLGLAPPAAWTTTQALVLVGGLALAMSITRAAVVFATSLTVGRLVHLELVPALRARVFDKLQRLSLRYFQRNQRASIINRVTTDVQSVRSFIDGVVLQGGILVLTLAVYVGYMAHLHTALTLACLAPTPLIWIATLWFSRFARPAYEKSRALADEVVLALSEGVKGIRVTKTFGIEPEDLARFQRRNRALRDQQDRIFVRVSRFSPSVSFVTAIALGILLVYGGRLVARGTATLGEMVVFAGLLQQFATQVSGMATVVNTLEQSLTAARRVFEVLDAPIEVAAPANPVVHERFRGGVRFEQVSFGYDPDKRVLDGVDFTVAPGQMVALIGAVGAGKSTLLSLIPRFYDPVRGRVRLDGDDVRTLDLDRLRRSVGVVFQETILFRGSIAENIAFGHPKAPREAVERAARVAGAHTFIGELPQGYETLLEEGGANLSGGQRQRLAIARALLLDPPLLLLDDPTSAVDAHTEQEILAAMEGARQGRTTIVATTRLSALRGADLILVLDGGRIVERGTHDELMAAGGLYARIAALQVLDEGAAA